MASRSIEPYKDQKLPERFLRWIETVRLRIRTIPCYNEGDGSPEGVVAGIQADRYYDRVGFLLFIKSTNTGNTGWLQVGGAGGAGGTPSRRNLLAEANLQSDGPDTSINFSAADYDPTNSRGLIGGNNSFVGSMANILSGKIVQPSALPSSVISNGSISDIRLNNNDGGVLVRIGNEFARANTAMSSWTDITPGFAVTYHGIESWKTTQIIISHTEIAGPLDYTVSTDNGATFPNQFGTAMGGTGRRGIRKSAGDGKLGIIGTSQLFAWTESADLTAASWNTFDFGTLFVASGNGTDMDWNTDGSLAIYATTTGDVLTSTNGGTSWSLFDRDLNYFRFGPSGGLSIDVVVYVADLEGWILFGGNGVAAFIADDDLSVMTVVNVAKVATLAPPERSRATDGTELLMPVTFNNGITLLQSS